MGCPHRLTALPLAFRLQDRWPKGWVYDMTNEGFSRQLGRLDKQLRRLEDHLAPPKQTEADRRLFERIEVGRKRAAERRASRGLAPLPERPPWVTPPGMTRGSIEELMAIIHAGRTRAAAEQKEREAEAERVKREAEAQTPGA
jgi:hypothetical protein